MISVFEFSNWNQLAGLRSTDYPYLKLTVDQFNTTALVGTKINIVDTSNNLIYFSGFIRVITSDYFNPMAVFEVDEIIKRINSYGFNIAYIEPIVLPPNVVVTLKGLQSLGYNYITLQYDKIYSTDSKSVYEYAIDESFRPDTYPKLPETELTESPYKITRNKYLVASKYLKDLPDVSILNPNQPGTLNTYVISFSPEFNWEDFKWVKPNVVYSISEVLLNSEKSE